MKRQLLLQLQVEPIPFLLEVAVVLVTLAHRLLTTSTSCLVI
ncbi:hypothetical protein VAE151_630740 [Vibrio aestuarianus]|uniref:Uncharacterized protein n=1 Tax=Vibrio aestuarianus TaxID=28171 RepID=A0ABN8TMQ2_9VIBR|nr:hypothetical protein VAE063_1010211 [Vibrio aestuarianus]CAH8227327.1 hypothetical protein VIBAE_B10824 [Vibrio aestuarianus subsp. francensis]CAH8229116.1 hypothetical protein VAE128_500733 [Vibrio aestuarianus]CAH8229128.1 hypothetical protein VAE032_330214 [Vibrio aestuarianus]CAH8229216.1 hypothetical protein VAE055_420741 [Vibrio aestuarianus]